MATLVHYITGIMSCVAFAILFSCSHSDSVAFYEAYVLMNAGVVGGLLVAHS